MAARQKAVVDKKIFFDAELRVTAFEVAGAITNDAVAQGQVLRARRGSDRVGLHEAEALDRPPERGRLEQRAGDRVAAQGVERQRRHRGHVATPCALPVRPGNRSAPIGRAASPTWWVDDGRTPSYAGAPSRLACVMIGRTTKGCIRCFI